MASKIPATKSPQAASSVLTEDPGIMASKVSQPSFTTPPICKRVQAALRTSTEASINKRAGIIQRRKSDSEVIMASRIPPTTPTSYSSQTARRRSIESRNSLRSKEMLRAPTVLSPPEHTANNSRHIRLLQKYRARVLTCLLRQYNIARRERDIELKNGTYDPNAEKSRVYANNIRRAILLIRRLYRQFFDASNQNNTERSDRILIENIMASGIISNQDALYVGVRSTSSSSETELSDNTEENEVIRLNIGGNCPTESEGSEAEQSLEEDDDETLMEELRIVVALRIALAQKNNPSQTDPIFECTRPQQLLYLDRMASTMQNEYWNTAEVIVRRFELETNCQELINELRPLNSHTDFERNLKTSPVNHTKPSEIRRVNSIKQIQDTSMQSGSNSPINNCPIAGRKTPVPQAGPSRIRLENLVAPIQDTTMQGGGNNPINSGQITGCKRLTPQASPSRIRQENPIDSILDSSSRDESSSPRNNASIKILNSSAQRDRSFRTRQENYVALIQDPSRQDEDNSLRNYGSIQDRKKFQPLSDPDMLWVTGSLSVTAWLSTKAFSSKTAGWTSYFLELKNGTYEPNAEQSRIDANNIRRPILRLYRQFVDASNRNDSELSDRILSEVLMTGGIISNQEALYVGRRVSSSSTESEDSQAKRPLHEEGYRDTMKDLRRLLVQETNAPCVDQSSQRPTPQQLSKQDLMIRRFKNEFWNPAELVQRFELSSEFHELIHELRHRNSHADFERNLETRPINHTERSEIRRVNPVDQIQNTSMQRGNNSPRSNCPIADHKMPVPQAGPSRIIPENRVVPIQDTTMQGRGNIPKSSDRITCRKRPAPQAGPSRFRQENPIAPIQDSSSQDEDNSISHKGSIQDRKHFGQQLGSSYNRDENPADQINLLRNYQPLSDPDMVPIGHGNAMVPRTVLDNIDWKVHTTATRQLLQAIFPRSVTANHFLTEKQSPACLNCPEKKILDPLLVEDIVETVSKKCEVPSSLVRSYITYKCTDEEKMFSNRRKQRKKRKTQFENKSPSSSDS